MIKKLSVKQKQSTELILKDWGLNFCWRLTMLFDMAVEKNLKTRFFEIWENVKYVLSKNANDWMTKTYAEHVQ